MNYLKIAYGLGEGFGGLGDWEASDAETLEATTFSSIVEQIMEEDDLDEDDAFVQWEKESWLSYEAREVGENE